MAGASSATQRTHLINAAAGEYIDLAGLLSDSNYRLYRQGMVYHARISVVNNNAAGFANNIEVLDNSWRIRKAWQVAKESWWESTAQERAAGIRPGRWNDFKIFFDSAHTAANSRGPTTAGDGEWNYTEAARADTGGLVQFQMLDATAGTRFGILREYDDMQDQVTDVPAAGASSMPYALLHAERVAAQADQLQEEGDLPPYDASSLNELANSASLTYYMTSPLSTGGNPVTTTGMLEIPCGLIKIPDGSVGGLFRIDFKAGNYKGVHAEVMA
jgi:hypothetical protein